MNVLEQDLGYGGTALTESTQVTLTGKSEISIAYEATKCYSAWIEIASASDIVLRRVPFISANKHDYGPISANAGEKVKVVANLNGQSRLKFSLYYGSSDDVGADTALVQASLTTDASTIGKWSLLFAADDQRMGASLQMTSGSGNLFVYQSDTVPTDGTKTGELKLPQAPTFYSWPYRPRKAHYIRGDALSLVASIRTW